jgi:hypothetical protein
MRHVQTFGRWLSAPPGVAAAFVVLLRISYAFFAAFAIRDWQPPWLARSNAFTDKLMSPGTNPVLYGLIGVWERFDTLWYLHIARDGYDRPAAIVFYPLYPLLIRAGSAIVPSPLTVALIVSTVATYFLVWGLQELIALDMPGGTPIRAVAILAAWPASFMLLAAYPDSLAIALSVWSIFFARKEKWWLAGVIGLFGGFTKAVGLVVAIPLGYLAWRGNRKRLPVALLPLVGPAVFAVWARLAGYQSAGDVYAQFWKTHPEWPWITLLHSIQVFASPAPNLLLRMNLLFFLLALALALLSGLRTEYLLYAAAALAMFLTKSTDPLLQSTMRYVLCVFPAVIGLAARLTSRAGLVLVLAAFLPLNALLLYEFFRWSLLV